MRRIIRSIVGSIVLLVGLVMLVLPGPALLVIPLGLAILAVDFPWAEAVMQKARVWFTGKKQSAPQSPNHPTAKMP
jgi:tellurite resistance protein TerC